MLLTPVFASSPTDPGKDSRAEIAGDFDRFLKLLTTQLMNQDPLSPMDSTDFTNQLVQFSQVEQSVKTNDRLTALLDAQEFATTTAATGIVGKRVDVLTEQVKGGGALDLFYALPENASEVTVRLVDSSGATVRTFGSSRTEGLHRVAWDGLNAAGEPVPEGTPLRFVVSAKTTGGAPMTAQVGRSAVAEDIRQTAAGLVAHVAGRDVPLDQIISVRAG